MRHKALAKKALSLLVVMTMLLSMVPMAYAEGEAVTLTGIEAPEKDTYTAEAGTEQSALGLPAALEATRQVVAVTEVTDEEGNPVLDAEGNPQTETTATYEAVTVDVAWTGDYDAETAGAYILTASAEGYVLADGVQWPTVAVTLTEVEDAAEDAAAMTEDDTQDDAGEATVIALINGEACTDLAALLTAVNSATAPTTIQLMSGFETSDLGGSVPFIIRSGQEFTLDLNGQTITYTSTNQNSYFIYNEGTLTITDSSGAQTGKIYSQRSAAAINQPGGKMTITGGTFEAPNGYAVYARGDLSITPDTGKQVTLTGSGALQVIGGTVEITDGTLTGANYYAVYTTGPSSQTTISGGTFQGKTNSFYYDTSNSEVDISGGTFNGGFAGQVSTDNLSISGGDFSSDVSAYVADGYKYENGEVVKDTPAPSNVAIVGNTEYATLQAAIDAAAEASDGVNSVMVKLLENTAESVTIPAGALITLDLNGKTLTNGADTAENNKATVYNRGTLTITDIAAMMSGEVGTVDNISHARSAVYNETGAACTILNGNFTRSRENGQNTDDNGGNSGYTILNHGTMTFMQMKKITVSQGADQAGRYSSMIENGWQDGSKKPADAGNSVMMISGGTFTGGLNTIKNDDYGELKILGGTFENASQATVMNWNVAEITGGTYTSDKRVVLNAYGDDAMDKGELTIKNGTFTAGAGYPVISQNSDAGIGKVEITGGTFNAGENASGVIYQTTTGTNSTVAVSAGTFNMAVPASQCSDGFEPKENGDGTYGVTKAAVARIDDTPYETLEAAIEAVQPGQTIVLQADVAQPENTPVKIVDMGEEDAPITLDLNGHTISGSNSQTGTTDTATNPGSILWLSGSYVTLTDTSDGDKGGIINESAANKTGSTLFVKASANNGGHVVIDGGVRIESKSAELLTKNIYFLKNTNKNAQLLLDIKNAEVISGGFTLYVSVINTYVGTGKVTIDGGEFTSLGKVNDTTAMSAAANATTINGGTFHSWFTSNANLVAADKSIGIAQEENGAYTVTVMAEAPTGYVAKVAGENQYVLSGNLYGIHILQNPTGKTIEVVKNTSYTFPQGKCFGRSLGEPDQLTLDLAENVSLSGGMTLQLADVTVTGAGGLADDFTWTPYSEDYEMTAQGEAGVYSCRFVSSAVGAYIVKADGTEIAYPLVYNALSAARSWAGCKVVLNQNAALVDSKGFASGVSLNTFSGVVADITLDLNGHTLSYTGGAQALTLSDGAKLTVTDESETGGGVLEVSSSAVAAIGASGNCEIVIARNATVKGTVLLAAANSVLTVSGTVDTTALADKAAISGNGSVGKGPTTITIEDGAVIKANTTDGHGIYHPQTGTLTISGNVEISGRTGVEIRSGTLTVSGRENGVPKISGTGPFAVSPNGSGTTTYGVGIAVAQHTTKNEINVTISDGEISGVYGLYESNPQENGSEDIAKVSVDIFGGTFAGSEADVESKDCVGFITGGTFDHTVPLEYCAEGYLPITANDKYTVGGPYKVAILRDGVYTGYKDFLSSVLYSNTKDGDTVVLLEDWAYTAFKPTIKTSITMDLNGHTLTGSHSQNPTFFIEKSSTPRITVTVKNGTIIATESDALRLGRNADVTLENVTLTGKTHGMTVGHYDYKSQPTVTVTGAETVISGETAGIVVYSKNSGTEGAELIVDEGVISGGRYGIAGNGTEANSNSQMSITINGGTVKSTGEVGAAIYHPQKGTLTITGGTVEGPVGVQMCGGNLIVSGDPAITATKPAGTKTETDGAIPDGAAISAVNRGYPNGTPTVTISGTPTVSATDGADAVQAYSWDNANNASSEWAEAGTYVNISSGSFSSQVPADYCATGYEPTTEADDGMYTVQVKADVEAVIAGTAQEGTLSEMLAAAAAGETVKLLRAVATDTVIYVKPDLTLDLNGQTLTAGALASFGVMRDSSDGAGMLKVAAERVSMRSSGGQAVLYNAVKDGFQFFDAAITNYAGGPYDAGTEGTSVKFYNYLSFKNPDAYTLLAAAGNGGAEVLYDLSWGDAAEEKISNIKVSEATLCQYAQDVSAGNALFLHVTGLKTVAGKTLSVTVRLKSQVPGLEIEQAAYSYTVPVASSAT